jgi:hypothetical protein
VQISGKGRGFLLLCAWFVSVSGGGQNLIWKDTIVLFSFAETACFPVAAQRFRLSQDLEYSLSCSALYFLNRQHGDPVGNVSLLQHFSYRSQATRSGNVNISNYFLHDLGIQYFFDSISRFQPDENSLDTQVDVRIGKNLSFAVFSNLTTRMFNSYFYASGSSGNLKKTLSASFLTPLLCTLSSGFAWALPQLGTLSMGLSSAKLTWICNREVYRQQHIPEFYGVPQDKNLVFEYGLSVHLLVDRDFIKRVHWNCDLLIFKNFQNPVDLVMKNLIGIRINRFLKTSIQTRLYYETEVSKNIRMENLLSLGFYFYL